MIDPLPETLLLVLCATLSDMEDSVAIRLQGCERLDFLHRFLPYKRGIPPHNALDDVINALDPELFAAAFAGRVEALRDADFEIVAIDGKTSRRIQNRRMGQNPLHWSRPGPASSGWCSDSRLANRNPTKSSPSRWC